MLFSFLFGLKDDEDMKNRSSERTHRRRYSEEFEEADSFFDEDGNEHLLDDDEYCEDCDDYHEEPDFDDDDREEDSEDCGDYHEYEYDEEDREYDDENEWEEEV